MIIGVDIDNVIADFVTPFLEFHNERYGTRFTREHITNHNFWDLWSVTKEEINNRLAEFNKTEYFENIKPVLGSQEGVKKLSRKHKLHVVTARPSVLYDRTVSWLNENFPGCFVKFIFTNEWAVVGESRTKDAVCLELGVNVLIEDSLENAKECASKGIKILLFDCPWNQSDALDWNIKRVYSWNEILENVNDL